jgi:hypothetical protein
VRSSYTLGEISPLNTQQRLASRGFLLCLLMAAGLSCGGNSSGPTTTVIAGVVISGPRNAAVGKTAQLSAVALDQNGQTLYGVTFEWSSSDNTIATVSSAGVVTGIAAGSATITARTGTVSDAVVMTVGPIMTTQAIQKPIARG